ncbi:amino acid/polyamine transporter [Reticulomyxa filosa]|uniref:Amino acid/polyamine transporter n=1 Tax=Reticulomyxa filosa TaxID=46433 RepID=X6P9L7_RETFI|nr:amino acid/polyamine transporter [Reticulomyxa filosa]|eukprot:ETO34813.1 amino acid/polyamine transporter [Reticulomyxa filosa]
MASARLVPNSSFFELSKLTVPKAMKLVDIAVVLKCFGVATSFLVVVGDLMPDVMTAILSDNSSDCGDVRVFFVVDFGVHTYIFFVAYVRMIAIFVVIFVVPFVRFKQMNRLKLISAAALLCFVYVLIVVILYAAVPSLDPCKNDDGCKGSIDAGPTNAFNFVKVLPIYIFCFTCHQNAFTITNELKDNSLPRLNKIIACSIAIAMSVYICFAYCAYFTFGSETESDILPNYPKSWAISIVRIVLAISLARQSLSSLVFGRNIEELDDKMFYLITYVFTLSAFALSMAVKNLGIVLAFVGATGSTAISYVLPGIYYYSLHKNDPDNRTKYVAVAMIILGCVITPFAVTLESL